MNNTLTCQRTPQGAKRFLVNGEPVRTRWAAIEQKDIQRQWNISIVDEIRRQLLEATGIEFDNATIEAAVANATNV